MALTLHQLRKRAATFALAAAIAAMSAGCSQIETDVTQGWDADRLYEEARAAAEDSDWTRAQDYYTKLESRYPFGRYAQQARVTVTPLNASKPVTDSCVNIPTTPIVTMCSI